MELNNFAWQLVERPSRTLEQTDEMLHAAVRAYAVAGRDSRAAELHHEARTACNKMDDPRERNVFDMLHAEAS